MAKHGNFALSDNVTPADIPAMADIFLAGENSHYLWPAMMRNVPPEVPSKLISSMIESRLNEKGFQFFKIVEQPTGKLVAFGGFKYPEPDEVKAKETKERLENPKMPVLPGIDERLCKIMFEKLLCATSRHGYDPGKHCHRRGTHVHSDYQRIGLGTMLTEQCNRIADEAKTVTYASTMDTSRRLFEKAGFDTLQTIETDVQGDGTEIEKLYVMRREPRME